MSDFSVSFKNLKSSIPKVLKLLYESGVDFECDWNEEFSEEVNNTISELNPVWLKKIGFEKNTENNVKPLLRKPNLHFREFCGYEWMNKQGKMTVNQAIDFLNYHIERRKIKEVDGLIYMNEWMQGLLQEYRSVIYREELPILVERLFVD